MAKRSGVEVDELPDDGTENDKSNFFGLALVFFHWIGARRMPEERVSPGIGHCRKV